MATKTKSTVSFSEEQKKLLEDALKKQKPTEYIETGNVGFDLALSDGKGLPIGSSTLFWAKPACGKTTVLVDVSKRLIQQFKKAKKPFKVLFLAVEDSMGLMEALGMKKYMDSGDFIYVGKQLCWRYIETFYEAVLNGAKGFEDVKLIIIDSVNNVLSDQNMKNSVADGDYGTKARERSSFYSKYLPICKEKGISSFFISQIRKKQQALMYEDPDRAAVTDVDLHNVDIIIKCSALTSSSGSSKIEEETAFGKDKVVSKYVFKMDSKATSCKNRYIRGNAVELLIEKGKCICNYYTVGKLLKANKLITAPSSGWYAFNADICSQLGIPTNKMRQEEVDKIVNEHINDFITILKKIGKYKVVVKETEVAVTDEEAKQEVPEDNNEEANKEEK